MELAGSASMKYTFIAVIKEMQARAGDKVEI
jgi:hypothetical protein